MTALSNRTVAITEHRFEQQLEKLIVRHGARVVSCPLIEERPFESAPELRAFVEVVIADEFDLVVFFTGVGLRFLAAEAEAMGRLDAFRQALERNDVVVRGPKPRAALHALGLAPKRMPEKPTSEGLLELLAPLPLAGARVGVQLYGAPNPDFLRALEARGARVSAVQVYDYRPASDAAAVERFIGVLLEGGVDVITFTSAPQVRALFAAADQAGLADRLAAVFGGPIQVASVGEVTTRALAARGVAPAIVPETPKMGALVAAIAAHFHG